MLLHRTRMGSQESSHLRPQSGKLERRAVRYTHNTSWGFASTIGLIFGLRGILPGPMLGLYGSHRNGYEHVREIKR